jgi:uncharacterized membrane protein
MRSDPKQPQALTRLATNDEPMPAQVAPRIPLAQATGEIRWLLLIAIAAAISALVGAPIAIRVVLGIPLVLFLPGYALVTALFPSREGLDGIERVALSFGLSLALLPLIALGIEYSPSRLALGPILVGLVASTLVFSAVAVFRRRRLPINALFVPAFPSVPFPSPGRWDRQAWIAVGTIITSLLLLAGAGAVIIADRLHGDPMTEFAVYNADGEPEFYPRQITAGQPATFMVEIANSEGEAEQYRLRVTAAGSEITTIDDISVADGDTWKQPVQLEIPVVGEQVQVVFDLYHEDGSTDDPYRSLWILATTDSTTEMPALSP